MLRPINTRADLLRHAKEQGYVDRVTLEASGLGSVGAVAAELRRIGYRVEIPPDQDRIYIIEEPGVGAKRRKSEWIALFDAPATPERPLGFGESEKL